MSGVFTKPSQNHMLSTYNPLSISAPRSIAKSCIKERTVYHKKQQNIQQMMSYMLLQQKFDQIYKKIEKISLKDDRIISRIIRKNTDANHQHRPDRQKSQKNDHPKSPEPKTAQTKKKTADPQLKIGLLGRIEMSKTKNNSHFVIISKKTKYRKKILQPLGKNMSNNIRDYLSVARISVKELTQKQETNFIRAPSKKHSTLANTNTKQLKQRQIQEKLIKHQSQKITAVAIRKQSIFSSPKKKLKKFQAPFELYFYRDFLWKVGYSNKNLIDIPQEYDSKLKFYVGGGNNSNLIKGVMRRRPWFQLTEKIQDAQFVWTQIKIDAIFQGQKKIQTFQPLTKSQNKTKRNSKIMQSLLIFNNIQLEQWSQYWIKNISKQQNMKQNMKFRSKQFDITPTILSKQTIHNHFIQNFLIGNKKALFQTMSEYYQHRQEEVFASLPLTFHIKKGIEDDEYLKFLKSYYAISKQNKNNSQSITKFNAWIVKPGENTNRGNGIIVCLDLNQIKAILKRQQKHQDGTKKTYILQKYIQKPLLYQRRKFDLRHYMMMNCSNGYMKGYWYKQGYVRTTSSQYSLKNCAQSIHLTNDAVQKHLPDYGKYQKCNKISYQQLNQHLKNRDGEFDFWEIVYPQMKKLATDCMRACGARVDPHRRGNFQIFGMDFMIDENYRVWLIQINSNPCLQTSCPLLNNLIPRMIENTLQICLDPLFPPPINPRPFNQPVYARSQDFNKYQLVYDMRLDQSLPISCQFVQEPPHEDVFEDDGDNFGEEI